jgi:ABC-2 type transport system ATP-binding protein
MMNENMLEARSLTRRFNGFTAVDNIDLEIKSGEIFGFLGPNGAGKSTTINMLCGLLKPTSGEVFYSGRKIYDNGNIRNYIGLCPQENIFWPDLTLLEQLIYIGVMYNLSTRQAREKSAEMLKDMGLYEKRNVLASKLSGGMKRRLNICLALINDPKIVILDEPEAGLDPQSRVMVREYVARLARHKTVILTTHNMDEADRLADRIAIIDHGKILITDTTENLKKTIGEGDRLELTISGYKNETINIPGISAKINRIDNNITIQAKNIIENMPLILQWFYKENITISELNLKQSTLEDVFVSLTGRTLRN